MEDITRSAFSSRPVNDSIQESVRLLDTSLNPSRNLSIFRLMSNSPQRRSVTDYRRDSYEAGDSRKSYFARNVHDLSITVGPDEISKCIQETTSGTLLKEELWKSFTLGPDEISKCLRETTTGVLLTEQEPWKNAADRLFNEFLESWQSHGAEQQVFETVADFIQTLSDTLELWMGMEDKVVLKSAVISKHKEWLENERNTWRLVYCLYQNRINSHFASSCGDKLEDDLMELALIQQSEKEIVQQLYKRDNVTRECQLVIDWLEQNASEERRDEHLHHFTDKTVAWENTLHQLQNRSSKIPYGSSRPIVSKIDPDAPLRENKPLHDIDMEDESRLVKDVFIHIRCGRLEQAQSLCMHTGQEWRAAALEGWRLHHDPNYDTKTGVNGEEKLPVEGNPNRDIWKLMAWQMAEDKRMPIYARATFAAMSGHLNALIAVCQSWEDLLWAYLRVLVDIRVEKEIRSSSLRNYVHLPESYWSNDMDIEDIFSELAASKEVHIRNEAMSILHRVQQFLIMDQVGTLMEEMDKWIKSSAGREPQTLRFLAHLVLFLRLIGRAEKEHIGDATLQAYVKELVRMRDPQLVAHYVATLPQDDQVTLYAEFLADIIEPDERDSALSAAEDADLDIETITKAVVENIRNQESSSEMPSLQAEITSEDLIKVSALDWVVHYPTQRAEAMWQANALVRHFLAVSKLEAARKAFNKIPIESIDLIMKQYQAVSENINLESLSVMQNLPVRVSSSIREYLCYKAYLDAQEGFSDWFQHYHHAKPVAPKLPSGEVPFTERVAFEHRSNQYKSDMERWKMAMQQQTKTVKSQLYNVLTFPEGGWLVDSANSDSDDDIDMDDEMSRRQKQMSDLRQLCIPKVTLLLHTVLHQMGEYAECIHLADLIVSEQHKLYKVFTKTRLGELLGKISESSLSLLDQKRDPWGCPVSS